MGATLWWIVFAIVVAAVPRVLYRGYRRRPGQLTSVEMATLTFSFIGLTSETTRVHTRLRCFLVQTVAFLAIMCVATLGIEKIHSPVLWTIAWSALGVSVALWAVVACVNRPRWAVPPALRGERGLIRLPGQPAELWTLPEDERPVAWRTSGGSSTRRPS